MSILPNASIGALHELVGHAGLGEVAGEHRVLARDLLSGLLCDVAVEIVDEHLRAVRGEQLCGGAPDAARGAL